MIRTTQSVSDLKESRRTSLPCEFPARIYFPSGENRNDVMFVLSKPVLGNFPEGSGGSSNVVNDPYNNVRIKGGIHN